jgi:hypothetical protein
MVRDLCVCVVGGGRGGCLGRTTGIAGIFF